VASLQHHVNETPVSKLWLWQVNGPVRPTSSAHYVGVQVTAFLVEKGELSRRARVVALERKIAGIVDQGMLSAATKS